MKLMDTKLRNLRCQHIQGDEMWSFVGKKQRNVREDDSPELGDAWIFIALDAESKLIPAFVVGKRNRETTYAFLTLCATESQRSIDSNSRQTDSLFIGAE
jgi:IS1 family transposase